MSRHDHTRDPCPWVILNDFGGAFAMGAVGGTVWHGIKGARNSPRGDRLIGSLSAIKARAPVVGGNFGVWGGLFSTFDCAVKGYRQKEDPYNAIISGFLTGGTLAVRSESILELWPDRGGPKGMLGGAIGCAILLGVFEGVGVLVGRLFAENNKPISPLLPENNSPPPPPPALVPA
ncbi:BQ5605_C025g10031 [Microbotryum silenes-dioicae]|uniref:BQ5605_C025g10031 protein n=1 Tax=Microbotryum silenes-dioicae TaxID=796604 RepID=A0A2X0PMK6_9BASI|nr:BQ5605_C025g10031 [Microbotryum silenes-dioicae]